MRDRCHVPKGAWAGPPLVSGMRVPQKKGAFRFHALLYWVKADHAERDQSGCGAALKTRKRRSSGRSPGKEVSLISKPPLVAYPARYVLGARTGF